MDQQRDHQLAIVLKYEGKSYKEISEALDNRLAYNSIRNYFAKGGLLDLPYKQYCRQMGQAMVEEGVSLLKKEVPNAMRVLVNLMAIHLNEAKIAKAAGKTDLYIEHYEKASVFAEKILDRAGLSAVYKLELPKDKPIDPIQSYEQFKQLCAERGIDPDSGLPIAEAEILQD